MSKPIWQLFVDPTDHPVAWINHHPNPRFAIFHSGSATDPQNDLVWDKETDLVWARHANLTGMAMTWLDANTTCRQFSLGHRRGWRLPTVEELSSLADSRQPHPSLPAGHPFVSVQCGEGVPAYWTSTNYENASMGAWFVNFSGGVAGHAAKNVGSGFVWPVRGGRSGLNWNW